MKQLVTAARSAILTNLLYLTQSAGSSANRQIYLNCANDLMRQRRATGKPYRHIVFDLDSLLDTDDAVLHAWRDTLAQYHCHRSPEELSCLLGVSFSDALARLSVCIDRRFEEIWTASYQKHAARIRFFDGVPEMLRAIQQSGYSIGIITVRRRAEIHTCLHRFHFEQLFDCVICADDIQGAQDPLQVYAAQAGVPVSACVRVTASADTALRANRAGACSALAAWIDASEPCAQVNFLAHTPAELAQQLL